MEISRPKFCFIKTRSLSNGFTILEILIVVIIIAVLTSLALPKFYGLVERTRIVEGVNMLMMMRSYIERCHAQDPSYTSCSSAQVLAEFTEYTNAPNSHFQFAAGQLIFYGGVGPSPYYGYQIILFRNNNELPSTDPGGNYGCDTLIQSSTRSALVLCMNTGTDPGDGKIYVRGSGFYNGYYAQ